MGRRLGLNAALSESLRVWRTLVQDGRPRDLTRLDRRGVDTIVFTDGSWPESRKEESGPGRIGALVLDVNLGQAWVTSWDVPDDMVASWLPRDNQIAMVELLAPVVVWESVPELLRDRNVLLLVDNDGVESALVRGYSAKEDICRLVSVFWCLTLRCLASVYVDRVPTDSNPSDPPSRGFVDDLLSRGARWFEPVVRPDVWERMGLGMSLLR
jgi:hypothetical protein